MKDILSQPCPDWIEKLSAWQLHALSPLEQQETERHIATCSACSAVIEQYQHIDVLLKGLPVVQPRQPLPAHLLTQSEKRYAGGNMREHVKVIPEHVEEARDMPNESSQRRTANRFLQVISTLAAVLVVTAIATSAFVLFSHRNSDAGNGGPAPSKQNEVYYNPEIPGNAGRANIYAFNPDNGSVVWRTHLSTKLNTSLMEQYEGKIFAPGYDSNMYALDASNGQVLWKYSIKNDKVYPGASQKDNSPSSAIPASNTIYFGASSGVYAVDIASGKLLWHMKPLPTCQGSQVTSSGNTTIVNGGPSCNIVPVAATKDIVFTYIDGLYALNASTGEILWKDKNIPFTGYRHLVVASEKVYLVTPVAHSNSCGSKLSILQANNGQVIKTLASSGCNGNVTVNKGIVVFNSDQNLIAFSNVNDKILWQKQTSFEKNFLLATDNSYAYYQGISNLKQQSSSETTYDESYYALDIQTGNIQWKWTRRASGDGGYGSPGGGVIVNGKLCFFYVSDFSNTGKEGMFVIDNGKKSFYPLPGDWQS